MSPNQTAAKKTNGALEMLARYLKVREMEEAQAAEFFACEISAVQDEIENMGQNVAAALEAAGMTYDEAFVIVFRAAL